MFLARKVNQERVLEGLKEVVERHRGRKGEAVQLRLLEPLREVPEVQP